MSKRPAFSCDRCHRPATGDEADSRRICNRCRKILKVEIPLEHPHRWGLHTTALEGPLLRRTTNAGMVLGIAWAPNCWTTPMPQPKGKEWPHGLQIGAVTLQCPNGRLHDWPPRALGGASGPAFRDGKPMLYGIHPLLHDEAGPGDHCWYVAYRSVAAAVAAADEWADAYADGWSNAEKQLALF